MDAMNGEPSADAAKADARLIKSIIALVPAADDEVNDSYVLTQTTWLKLALLRVCHACHFHQPCDRLTRRPQVPQDVLDALKQDFPSRNKPPISQQSQKWPAHTKLVSRAKALALLGILYYLVLPVTVAVAVARAALAWLFTAKAAAANGHSNGGAADGQSGQSRGTALVSGGWPPSVAPRGQGFHEIPE